MWHQWGSVQRSWCSQKAWLGLLFWCQPCGTPGEKSSPHFWGAGLKVRPFLPSFSLLVEEWVGWGLRQTGHSPFQHYQLSHTQGCFYVLNNCDFTSIILWCKLRVFSTLFLLHREIDKDSLSATSKSQQGKIWVFPYCYWKLMKFSFLLGFGLWKIFPDALCASAARVAR